MIIKRTWHRKGLDFDAEKPRMYSDIRSRIAMLYAETEDKMSGPVETTTATTQHLSDDELKSIKAATKKQRELITRGRSRILEKIKDIRQNFSRAVVNGTRSGSGKIVYEHYDKLSLI